MKMNYHLSVIVYADPFSNHDLGAVAKVTEDLESKNITVNTMLWGTAYGSLKFFNMQKIMVFAILTGNR
jgi:hypothetical protein